MYVTLNCVSQANNWFIIQSFILGRNFFWVQLGRVDLSKDRIELGVIQIIHDTFWHFSYPCDIFLFFDHSVSNIKKLVWHIFDPLRVSRIIWMAPYLISVEKDYSQTWANDHLSTTTTVLLSHLEFFFT